MRSANKPINQGFTLIEMLTVIVLLGVMSVGITSFLKIGTQAYVDVTARDELIASGRFAVERLNRDLRSALPNSVRLTDANQCIEFYSSVASAVYTDAPVAPEAARDTIDIIKFNDDIVGGYPRGYRVAIYPLIAEDLFPIETSGRIAEVKDLIDLGSNKWQIELVTATTFEQDSPTKRVYFIDPDPVKYCLEATADDVVLKRNGILMAENIAAGSEFTVNDATHLRNSVITALLTFDNNGERVTFNNEIQVINVP